VGLRISDEEEEIGADALEHGIHTHGIIPSLSADTEGAACSTSHSNDSVQVELFRKAFGQFVNDLINSCER